MKRVRLAVVIVSVIALSAIAWAGTRLGPNARASAQSDPQIAAMRQNAHTVQMAVESYAMDHGGKYPQTLMPALSEGGYLAALPDNPYLPGSPLPEVRAGYDQPGGLSYVPLIEEDVATGYVLLAYGDARTGAYLDRTRQNFERYLPDNSHGSVEWRRVVQSLGGGKVASGGVGAQGGAGNISDAPCQ